MISTCREQTGVARIVRLASPVILSRRGYEHRNGFVEGHTQVAFDIHQLVYLKSFRGSR